MSFRCLLSSAAALVLCLSTGCSKKVIDPPVSPAPAARPDPGPVKTRAERELCLDTTPKNIRIPEVSLRWRFVDYDRGDGCSFPWNGEAVYGYRGEDNVAYAQVHIRMLPSVPMTKADWDKAAEPLTGHVIRQGGQFIKSPLPAEANETYWEIPRIVTGATVHGLIVYHTDARYGFHWMVSAEWNDEVATKEVIEDMRAFIYKTAIENDCHRP